MSDARSNDQQGDLDVALCTCANLRKATRVITQAFDAALQPTGLKATQFTVLATLARQGDGPLTLLAETLVMDRTTLTRNLKPLVRKGLIRIDHEEDQRIRKVVLTEAGRSQFETALSHWKRTQARIRQQLGPERWAGLLDDLAATVDVAKAL